MATKIRHDGEDEDEFLSEHTKSMRLALDYCQRLVNDSKNNTSNTAHGLPQAIGVHHHNAQVAARRIPDQRLEALDRFWTRQKQSAQQSDFSTSRMTFSSDNPREMAVDVLDLINPSSHSSSASIPSVRQFRQRYQHVNQPCLIRGWSSSYFFNACSQWRQQMPPTTDNQNDENYQVNRSWFLHTLGPNAMVPVRVDMSSQSTTTSINNNAIEDEKHDHRLDDQGRATECQTKHMALREWIQLLEKQRHENNTVSQCFYLKDWHLQSWLRQQQPSQPQPLYDVPCYFGPDLLNDFLLKFSTSHGDYMFTYWGPKGSSTNLHADVLQSFSWSFNVVGTKKWTFYPPTPSTFTPLVVIQHAGDCMFVPAGWTHEVVNMEETLSINHNWITTANLDLTWDCLCQEMQAIDTELQAWGDNLDSRDLSYWEARESMLRGCTGLDVTAFVMMVLTRLLELLLLSSSFLPALPLEATKEGDDDDTWTLHFDLTRLKDALHTVFYPPCVTTGGMDLIQAQDRMAAVFQSQESAALAMELAVWAMEAIP